MDANDIDPKLAPPLNPSDEIVAEAMEEVRHTIVDLRESSSVCDFCNGPEPVCAYPTTGVAQIMGPVNYLDLTPWNACTVCSGLIAADRYTSLAERHLDLNPGPDRAFRARTLQALYSAFKQGRNGPPTPLNRGQSDIEL